MIMHTKTGKVAWLLCAVFAACGDDGTERLSTCPEQRIETDKMGIIRCAGPSKPDAENSDGNAGKTGTSSGSQRSMMQASRAGQDSAERSDGEPAANGGSAAPAGGNAGKPAAESGADAPSQSGGSGTPAPSGAAPGSSGGGWYCVQVMNACSCVMGSIASDGCTSPRPTCCVTVKNDASVNTCVCYPEGSTECTGVKQNPSVYPPVSECPPK